MAGLIRATQHKGKKILYVNQRKRQLLDQVARLQLPEAETISEPMLARASKWLNADCRRGCLLHYQHPVSSVSGNRRPTDSVKMAGSPSSESEQVGARE